jgi:hypothetical protein
MDDIQINEEALERCLQRSREIRRQREQNKIGKAIRRYFREVIDNFNYWKTWMSFPNEVNVSMIKNMSRAGVYYYPYAFHVHKSYRRHRTQWEIYASLVDNPTVQGFVEYKRKWVPGVEYSVPLTLSPQSSADIRDASFKDIFRQFT